MLNDKLSYDIRGAAMEVYNTFGPGLLESVYQKALKHELELRGHNVHSECTVPIIYKDKVCILLGSEVETSEKGRNHYQKYQIYNNCSYNILSADTFFKRHKRRQPARCSLHRGLYALARCNQIFWAISLLNISA